MKRVALLAAVCVLASSVVARRAARRPRPCRRSARQPSEGSANRSHRLLGVADHRGLEVPDGHARQGRLRRGAADPGRPEGGRELGSGEGRSGGRAVPGLRRRRHHASARAPAHLVAGRHDAESGDRYRHADAAASFRQCASSRRGNLAGAFGGAVERRGAQSQSRHHQPAPGLCPQERRTLRREGDGQ